MEATSRTEGNFHQALTINILWQLWKVKNEKIFNNKYRHPFEIVQKAHLEWLEYTEAQSRDKRVSIQETTSRNEEELYSNDENNLMNIVVEVSQQEEEKPLGIGIVATQGNNTYAVWAIRERSTGESMLEYAAAIKLTLCKAREKL